MSRSCHANFLGTIAGDFMPNDLKFCGCDVCRRGMHYSACRRARVKRAVRSSRRKVKKALTDGKEPSPAIPVGYTD